MEQLGGFTDAWGVNYGEQALEIMSHLQDKRALCLLMANSIVVVARKELVNAGFTPPEEGWVNLERQPAE